MGHSPQLSIEKQRFLQREEESAMGTGRSDNKTPMTRPVKSGAVRARRLKVHKKRLLALGVPEEKMRRMTCKEIRQLLQRPLKTAAAYSA